MPVIHTCRSADIYGICLPARILYRAYYGLEVIYLWPLFRISGGLISQSEIPYLAGWGADLLIADGDPVLGIAGQLAVAAVVKWKFLNWTLGKMIRLTIIAGREMEDVCIGVDLPRNSRWCIRTAVINAVYKAFPARIICVEIIKSWVEDRSGQILNIKAAASAWCTECHK